MKVAAIICFLLAALFAIGGLNVALQGPSQPEGSENVIGYVVGAMLPTVVLVIVGLWLWQKAKRRPPS